MRFAFSLPFLTLSSIASAQAAEIRYTSYLDDGPAQTSITIPLTAASGSLEAWTAPTDCFSAKLFTNYSQLWNETQTGPLATRTVLTGLVIHRISTFGCQTDRKSCCPPGWQGDGYYYGSSILIPKSYSAVRTTPPNVQIIQGSVTGAVICPTLPSSVSLRPIAPGFFHDVILPISMYTPDEDQLVCRRRFIDDVKTVEFFQNSVKAYVVEWAIARPILLIGSANPTPTSTDDGDVADLAPSDTIDNDTSDFQPPTNTNKPKEVTNQRSGLPAGVIVGIAVGGLLPIVAIAIFVAYRFGRRSKRARESLVMHPSAAATNPGTPIQAKNMSAVGTQPFDMAGYGGIQEKSV